MRITIRLNDTETQQLHAMVTSENSASENTGEFIRMLIAREWNRRKGLPKPEPKQFQTAFRTGRPNSRYWKI